MEINAFQLSRIYAQGWSAARKLLADGNFGIDGTDATALNSYRSAQETSRWAKGFEEALQSRTTPAKTSKVKASVADRRSQNSS